MSFTYIVLIALGLAMDAFAVSLTSGVCMKVMKIQNALKMVFFFGVFQMLMPIFGWILGEVFYDLLDAFDHWIAFLILAFLGAKMIYESRKEDKECPNFTSTKVVFFLAIATSIDAFAVGVSFAFLKVFIVFPVIIIGLITFMTSFSAVFIGKKFGDFLGKKAEVLGGIILIAIGFRILLYHIL